jgi:hypothetical protein
MHGYFTVSKKNGELKFEDFGGYETRNPSTIWCIKEADKIYNWKDFNSFSVVTYDWCDSIYDVYAYSKTNSYNKIVPDFNFHAWPQVGIQDYNQLIHEIHNAGSQKFEINKVGWIGNKFTNDNRITMIELGKLNPHLFDFFDMEWINEGKTELKGSTFISLPDLVKKYSILIDIEGTGYSGRLKFLLWSLRPILLVDRPHKEYFFEHLKEWEHYIPVKRDLSDLGEKTLWCLKNYNEALKIAENAYNFSKIHLTREACYKKWNDIILDEINKC